MSRGFTLIELILVVILLAVVSVSVIPRFDDDGTSEYLVQDELLSSLRNVQQRAMQDTANRYCLNIDTLTPNFGPPPGPPGPACSAGIDASSILSAAPTRLQADGIALSATDLASGTGITQLRFDRFGIATSSIGTQCPAGCEISVTASTVQTLCVEPQGYIHEGACR